MASPDRGRHRGPHRPADQPRQGAVPVGVHQGRGRRLPPAHRADDRPAPRRVAASRSGATPTAPTTTGSSRSAARRTVPSGCRSRSGPGIVAAASSTAGSRSRPRWCGRRTWRRSNSTRRWRSPADLDTPRTLVFDFDPGPKTSIVECCEVALGVRAVLDSVGLEGWCKTSGSKGLQLYVPLNTPRRHPRGDRRLRARRRPGDGTPAARPGDDGDGQGRAARQGVRRLEPERPPQDHDRPVLAARPPRPDGVDAGHLGRGRAVRRRAASSCASRPPTCWRRVDEFGDLFAPVLTLEQRLPTAVLIDADRPARPAVPRWPCQDVE